MKIKKFEEMNEGIIDWDASNIRAANKIANSSKKYEYIIDIKAPCEIKTKDDDFFNKLKFYLTKARTEFDSREEEID